MSGAAAAVLSAPLGPPPVLRRSLALHVSVRQPAVQGGAAALASDPIAYWVRGGHASLALLAFAVSVAGAQCAVARRRGAFVLQRRSLVGLLDAATCRKSPLSCSSSCYAALNAICDDQRQKMVRGFEGADSSRRGRSQDACRRRKQDRSPKFQIDEGSSSLF